MIQKLDAWHRTKLGLAVFAVLELLLAYGFASAAIDRGNFLWYLLALISLVGFLKNIFELATNSFRSTKLRSKKR